MNRKPTSVCPSVESSVCVATDPRGAGSSKGLADRVCIGKEMWHSFFRDLTHFSGGRSSHKCRSLTDGTLLERESIRFSSNPRFSARDMMGQTQSSKLYYQVYKVETRTVAYIHTLANWAKWSVSWDSAWASLALVIPWGQCAAFRFWLIEFTVEQMQNPPARYRQQLVCPGSVKVSTGSTDLGSTCSAWTQTLSLSV